MDSNNGSFVFQVPKSCGLKTISSINSSIKGITFLARYLQFRV